LPVNIEDFATRSADGMIVVLRGAVDAQPIAGFGDPPAQAGTDKGIESLIHRR
jgi:hypothetical protein